MDVLAAHDDEDPDTELFHQNLYQNLSKFDNVKQCQRQGIKLPSIFEKHKICSNRTKTLLLVK